MVNFFFSTLNFLLKIFVVLAVLLGVSSCFRFDSTFALELKKKKIRAKKNSR